MHFAYQPPSKLKIPASLQPCSSSPIRWRSGSADKVVLPVPERPKKQSGLAIDAAIGGTVHRENLTVREKIVQHRENGLFDLPCVTRSSDENEPGLEINGDDRLRAHVVDKRVCLKAGSNDDGEVRG